MHVLLKRDEAISVSLRCYGLEEIEIMISLVNGIFSLCDGSNGCSDE